MTTADRGDAPGLGALPQHAEARKAPPDPEGWWAEVNGLDLAVLRGDRRHADPHVGPRLSPAVRGRRQLEAVDRSAAVLATIGGPGGRRAAVNGPASVGVTSAVVNLVLKPLGRRHRPDRATHHVPITRQVTMPRTTSFPSGHAASASAFATGVASAAPEAGIPVSTAATLVGYSRSTRASTTPSM